ncbi:MAG: fumarylacetoacetate hydrolase family protein [Bdellovibrio sp.]
MESRDIEHWAKVLHQSRLEGKAIEQISNKIQDFKRSDAYSIQELGIAMRKEAGEKVIGQKMGLTSESKRKQMNLDSPLYGELTDKMKVENKGTFNLQGSIHPKIEPEIAFLMGKTLTGKVTREEAVAAVKSAASCMEILDSRYQGFKYFSMEDVISDNSSSSHFVVGPWKKDLTGIDWKNLKMKMYVNGQLAQEGISSAISDDPIMSIVQLVELMGQRGRSVEAGMIVLAGAATTAVALGPGMKVKLTVDMFEPTEVEVSR